MTSRLTLYSRLYCHLCEDMLAALDALHVRRGGAFIFDVDVVDVDADAVLKAKYNELVPVLAADGEELCRYFLDAAKVREYLSEHP